jgi:hypothetical protein
VVLVEVVTADECSAAVGTFGRFVIDVERAIMTLKVFLTAEGWKMERGTHIGGKMRLNTRNENCGSGWGRRCGWISTVVSTFGRFVMDMERAIVTLEVLLEEENLNWWEDEEGGIL